MPNQRDPRKKKIGVWMTPEEIASLKKSASDNGQNVTDYLKSLTNSYGKKNMRTIERQYKVKEAAEILSVTPRAIRKWVADGRLRATSLMGMTRIPESAIRRVICG